MKIFLHRNKFCFTVPAKLNFGKRKLLMFDTKEAAENEAKNLNKDIKTIDLGIPSMMPEDRLRVQALLKTVGGIERLESIVNDAKKKSPILVNKTLNQAFVDFMSEIEFKGVGKLQERSIRSRLMRFIEVYGTKQLSDITPSDLSQWLKDLPNLSNQTKRHLRQAASQLLGYCERMEWISRNPMELVEAPRVAEPPKEILTVNQFHKMLGAFEGEEKLFVALGGYAGLRTSEIIGNEDHAGITWDDIDLARGEIILSKGITKKKRERCIPICDPLKAILKEVKAKKGKVVPLSIEKMKAVRFVLAKAAGLPSWLDNALRHSFASYHLALNENAALTSLLVGHKDAATTHRHYARLVKKDEAAKWFEEQQEAE